MSSIAQGISLGVLIFLISFFLPKKVLYWFLTLVVSSIIVVRYDTLVSIFSSKGLVSTTHKSSNGSTHGGAGSSF